MLPGRRRVGDRSCAESARQAADGRYQRVAESAAGERDQALIGGALDERGKSDHVPRIGDTRRRHAVTSGFRNAQLDSLVHPDYAAAVVSINRRAQRRVPDHPGVGSEFELPHLVPVHDGLEKEQSVVRVPAEFAIEDYFSYLEGVVSRHIHARKRVFHECLGRGDRDLRQADLRREISVRVDGRRDCTGAGSAHA